MKNRFQPGPFQRPWLGFPAGGLPPAGTVLFLTFEVYKASPVVMTGPALTRGVHRCLRLPRPETPWRSLEPRVPRTVNPFTTRPRLADLARTPVGGFGCVAGSGSRTAVCSSRTLCEPDRQARNYLWRDDPLQLSGFPQGGVAFFAAMGALVFS